MKDGFLQLQVKKIAVIQLTALEVEFQQKGVGGVEMDSENLASLESNGLEGYPRDLGITQVTVFEGTIFEAGTLEIQAGKSTADEGAGFIFADFKI
ncbi:hypothetical protein [Algoriphagus jejuensis]|uniref:hypothetical protein n=1 Tax=Algoriphagus jejuensis TaxID=419934 RepID=UPI003CD09B79